MKNWQKDRNYRKYENADGSVKYIISVEGVDVEVSKEVYKVYSQADRKERYLGECEEGLLLSLERMAEDGTQLAYFLGRHVEPAEDTALRNMLVRKTESVIAILTPDEKRLVYAVVLGGMTEQGFADLTGVSQAAVHKKKKRIREKIFSLVGY